MSHCFECPHDGGNRLRCCGETIDEAIVRIAAMGVNAPRIAAWGPGPYMGRCSCGADFTGDKLAMMCLPCAIKAAELPPKERTPQEEATLRAIVDKALGRPEIDKSPVVGLLGAASRAKAVIETAAQGEHIHMGIDPGAAPADLSGKPRIGQTVRIGDRVGIVCALDDARCGGTYDSPTHGKFGVRFPGNRKARRAELARR